MKKYNSLKTFNGRNMSGARALWRATGVKEEDFKKPIIAVVNSFTQFVPGHVHLDEVGAFISEEIEKQGAIAKQFNTIAIDDGIAMGHDGMLFSLPSRELIADSVEYMCKAHCVDAMICVSGCDKITPGMLMASMRLNIPTVFVTGGAMEAGKAVINGKQRHLDLVDAMITGANPDVSDEESLQIEKVACPTCGSCSGMFTANSMACLLEAIGLALPGNGTLIATHALRKELFAKASSKIVELTKRCYEEGDESILPLSIATKEAFLNAMSLDIAMGGSTNTILHLLAIANEAGVDFNMKDIDALSLKTPHICKVSPSVATVHIENVHTAGGIFGILSELDKGGFICKNAKTIHEGTIGEAIKKWDITNKENLTSEVETFFKAAPANKYNIKAYSQNNYFDALDLDRQSGAIRNVENAYSKDGGLAVLFGNIAKDGCIVKTAGVDKSIWKFKGTALVFNSQDEAVDAILSKKVSPGDVIFILYEGPKGGPGMQEMLYPTSYLKSMNLGKYCALVTDGRFSGGTSGLSIGHVSPEAASGGDIALVENGDIVEIDIPNRSINLLVDEDCLNQRRVSMQAKGKDAYKPNRQRDVPQSLKIYASLVQSADKGAVRQKL